MQSHGTAGVSSIDWYKSSLCYNSECVEIAIHDGTVLMRSSAASESAYVHFTRQEFGEFLNEAKAGKFDVVGADGNLR
jgi:hypothetical protein